MTDSIERLRAALADRYRIERELGGGGMSRVFVAEEVQLGRQVVVKVLPPELGAGVSAERFRREIQLAARLQHPHVVPLIAAGQDNELFWYTMPFIQGESLRARLAREHELPVAEVVRVLRDVADALDYAHAQGVVHRDIKPDNVLTSGHHAVVTDFGVAKAISAATGPSSLTSVGIALGTPAYMAPEQASADPHTDHRADIYALGVLAYEMLTGKPPFDGAPSAVLAAHVTKTPTPVTDQRATVPAALAALVMKCLEKRPADRYQTAAEVHALLDAMTTPSGGTQPALAAPLPAGATPRRSGSRRRTVTIAIALVVVVAAGAYFLRDRLQGSVIPQASRMAIMPFGSVTGDSALAVLGRNLVVLVSASLDGVGEIRTVEPTTVLGRTSTPPTLDESFAHARALGASSVVHGTLVLLGRDARLDAAVYDIETRQIIARAGANGPVDNMAQLADSAAWSLLTAVWRARGQPTVSPDALTGRPLAAVREFVDGERALAQSNWGGAQTHYENAVAADSTFWLAYRRLAWVIEWGLRPVDASIHEAYRTHRAELPARERDLVSALLVSAVGSRLDSLREVARRNPDFWPAWLAYADQLFHNGALRGIRQEVIRVPWEHLRQILPAFAPTYEHILIVRAALGDTAATREGLDEWRALSSDSATGIGFVPFFFRSMARFRIDESRTDTLLTDSLVRAMAVSPRPEVWSGGFLGEIPFARTLSSSLARTALPAAVAPAFHRIAALALAQRGAWNAAVDSLVQHGATDAFAAYEFAAIGEGLGGFEPATGLRAKPAIPAARTSADSIRIAWADGMTAYARRDQTALAAARRAALAASHRRSAYVAASLESLAQDLAGQHAAAMNSLLTLERAYSDSALVTPVVGIAFNRLVLGRWLLSASRAAEADWALEAFDARSASSGLTTAFATLGVVALYHRGVAAEALGERQRARRFYQRFVLGYDLAPAHHRVWVDSATVALNR